jgi:hypothetical protein
VRVVVVSFYILPTQELFSSWKARILWSTLAQKSSNDIYRILARQTIGTATNRTVSSHGMAERSLLTIGQFPMLYRWVKSSDNQQYFGPSRRKVAYDNSGYGVARSLVFIDDADLDGLLWEVVGPCVIPDFMYGRIIAGVRRKERFRSHCKC